MDPHHDPHHGQHGHHDDFGGLAADLPRLLGRRRLLGLIGGAGVLALVGCADRDAAAEDTAAEGTATTTAATATTAATTATTATTAAADATATGTTCAVIPEETAGPYPGDGSNGQDILSQSGVVRSDIRTSIGSATGTAEGVPLTIALTVVDVSDGCTPLAGAAVYLWHCNRDGAYSMYSSSVADENYLRGVQEADAAGTVTFRSIYPACYDGRWPHIHYEVYESVAAATGGGTPLATSQIALPEDACRTVYATTGYEQSLANLSTVSLATDNVFADGWDQELGVVTGDVTGGLTVTLTAGI